MNYKDIVAHYESCLEKHGDTHLGVDWPKLEDVDKRYKVMFELMLFDSRRKTEEVSLLDFGCGAAHFLQYLQKQSPLIKFRYEGLDLSSKFVELAQKKFPGHKFYCGDILDRGFSIPSFDYMVLNGVFTEKRNLSQDEMWTYFTAVLKALYPKCNAGMAFNVMSKNVDWEREDLFHVSLDELSAFLCKNLGRNFIIRNDYGLYEYTVYLYK